MKRIISLGLLLVGLLLSATCSPGQSSQPDRVTELAAPDPALGEPLMVALAQARNFHHKADVLLAEARLDDAASALRQILVIPFPPGAPEAEDVLFDARARLAKLLVSRGAIDEALAMVDQGIASASRPSFFLANLYTARGEVLEARAQLADGSDPSAAKAARLQAIAAFDQSISINEALMKQLADEAHR